VFSVFLAGIDIHDTQSFTIICYVFPLFWLVCILRWPVGPLQLSFAPLAQTSNYATGCGYLKSNQKVLIYTTHIKTVNARLFSFTLRNKITDKQQ